MNIYIVNIVNTLNIDLIKNYVNYIGRMGEAVCIHGGKSIDNAQIAISRSKLLINMRIKAKKRGG